MPEFLSCLKSVLPCLKIGVNLNKLGILFSKGHPQSLRENMTWELRILEISHIGKHLGIPYDWGHLRNKYLHGFGEELI